MSALYALTDRRGDIGGRWTASQARAMYAAGVRHAVGCGELVQVWVALPNGDLLRYDAERTRRLTDAIVAYRAAVAVTARGDA